MWKQRELRACMCINTDSYRIKSGGRRFPDQNVSRSSFLLSIKESFFKIITLPLYPVVCFFPPFKRRERVLVLGVAQDLALGLNQDRESGDIVNFPGA